MLVQSVSSPTSLRSSLDKDVIDDLMEKIRHIVSEAMKGGRSEARLNISGIGDAEVKYVRSRLLKRGCTLNEVDINDDLRILVIRSKAA